MKKCKSKLSIKKLLPIIYMLICLSVGFAFGWFVMATADKAGANLLLVYIVLVISIYFAYYMQVIVHEAGHLIFGLITGYEFLSFRISSLCISKNNDKLKVGFIKVLGTAGQCLMSPPELVDGKMPFVLYHLGGCIANIVLSVICVVLSFAFSDMMYINMFFKCMAFIGFIFVLLNGIPLNLGISNDGYNFLAQMNNDKAIYACWLQLKANEMLTKGASMKDLPANWFYMPDEDGLKNILISTIGVFYANRLMAIGQYDECLTVIDRLLKEDTAVCQLHKFMLVCDKISCMIINNDFNRAHELLTKQQKQFMKQMKKFPAVLRTNYAIELLVNKNNVEAEKALKTFNDIATRYPYKGDIADEKGLIELFNNINNEHKENVIQEA